MKSNSAKIKTHFSKLFHKFLEVNLQYDEKYTCIIKNNKKVLNVYPLQMQAFPFLICFIHCTNPEKNINCKYISFLSYFDLSISQKFLL